MYLKNRSVGADLQTSFEQLNQEKLYLRHFKVKEARVLVHIPKKIEEENQISIIAGYFCEIWTDKSISTLKT